MMVDEEVVLETQPEEIVKTTLKNLSATKLLVRQKDAGFTYSGAEDPVKGRISKMEEVDVSRKVGKGRRRSDQ